jgi:hypothetical protein
MKIQFRIRGLNPTARLREWLTQPLEGLRGLVKVSAADVLIERHREGAPPFRAAVHLAVPGPDLQAEAQEHTLEAVWLKVTAALQKQIEEREIRRKARARSKRSLLSPNGRWSGSSVGARA